MRAGRLRLGRRQGVWCSSPEAARRAQLWGHTVAPPLFFFSPQQQKKCFRSFKWQLREGSVRFWFFCSPLQLYYQEEAFGSDRMNLYCFRLFNLVIKNESQWSWQTYCTLLLQLQWVCIGSHWGGVRGRDGCLLPSCKGSLRTGIMRGQVTGRNFPVWHRLVCPHRQRWWEKLFNPFLATSCCVWKRCCSSWNGFTSMLVLSRGFDFLHWGDTCAVPALALRSLQWDSWLAAPFYPGRCCCLPQQKQGGRGGRHGGGAAALGEETCALALQRWSCRWIHGNLLQLAPTSA